MPSPAELMTGTAWGECSQPRQLFKAPLESFGDPSMHGTYWCASPAGMKVGALSTVTEIGFSEACSSKGSATVSPPCLTMRVPLNPAQPWIPGDKWQGIFLQILKHSWGPPTFLFSFCPDNCFVQPPPAQGHTASWWIPRPAWSIASLFICLPMYSHLLQEAFEELAGGLPSGLVGTEYIWGTDSALGFPILTSIPTSSTLCAESYIELVPSSGQSWPVGRREGRRQPGTQTRTGGPPIRVPVAKDMGIPSLPGKETMMHEVTIVLSLGSPTLPSASPTVFKGRVLACLSPRQ